MKNKIFNYNGNPITFQIGDARMVNATEMAKPFWEKPVEWLSNKQTKEIINTLQSEEGIPTSALIQIVNVSSI